MADRTPDEIISEILSPLLKHSDAVFSDNSEKPLVSGYSSSTYLLVCKAWLRVSTPLLYNVVILRTSAQAEALEKVLKDNGEFGAFIKKLRIEGGFGNAMYTILRHASNITDLFLTLCVWGSDTATGLCKGLPLINPRRVVLVDGPKNPAGVWHKKPKKNKHITQLLETLCKVIPKWDKLSTFDFPYVEPGGRYRDPTYNARAESLAHALQKSKSLEILRVCMDYMDEPFQPYLVRMVDAPCLNRLHISAIGVGGVIDFDSWLKTTRKAVNAVGDPNFKALVTYDSKSPTVAGREVPDFYSSPSTLSNEASDEELTTMKKASIQNLKKLESLGKATGTSLQELNVSICEPAGRGPRSRSIPAPSLVALGHFTALTHLRWDTFDSLTFSTPAAGFSILPKLRKLFIRDCSPSFFAVLSQLYLDTLRDVSLGKVVDVPAAVNFLQRHGSKLTELTAPLEVLVNLQVFNVCTSLHSVVALQPVASLKPERRALPEDFVTCIEPHKSLVKIGLQFRSLERQHKFPLKQICTTLDTISFPALKEIQVPCAIWPTSEQEVSKNECVKCSDLLRIKGIKLTDENGLSWTPRATH